MSIWAIGDLHLSFGVADKSMDVFGPAWHDHAAKIADHWDRSVSPQDLVLIPGDISWALRLEEVLPDLQWIHKRPGTKVMIKGNHDFWWGSLNKLTAILPPSIHVIQNNAFSWQGVAIGGARLWDTPEYSFNQYIEFRENPRAKDTEEEIQEDLSDKIFERELQRLTASLSALDPKASLRIAMTHYPPIGPDLAPSRASAILEAHQINICVFGHLHNLKTNHNLFSQNEIRARNGVTYLLTSCDAVEFQLVKIV